MFAFFNLIGSVRMIARKIHNQSFCREFGVKAAVMSPSAIADARIPTIDVPFLAHVCTSRLDVCANAYFFGSKSTKARVE